MKREADTLLEMFCGFLQSRPQIACVFAGFQQRKSEVISSMSRRQCLRDGKPALHFWDGWANSFAERQISVAVAG
jgi:hypothetical protein